MAAPSLSGVRPGSLAAMIEGLADRGRAGLLGLALAISLLSNGALAAEAALTVNLEAARHKAVRLRNLPKDAVMGVAVQSTGRIAISLLSEADYKKFPNVSEPVFAGSVERTLSFQIVIPDAGNYYLVLDNRRGTEERKVKVGIRAQRGRAAPPIDPPAPEPGAGERKQGA
jgi:hypothetical protein